MESTQATAGTWATPPSKVQLFGPGVKKPGDVVQAQTATINASNNVNSGTFAVISGDTISITLRSAADLICVEAAGNAVESGAAAGLIRLSRGTTNNTNMIGGTGGAPTQQASAYLLAYDLPNVTTSVTYAVQGAGGGTTTFPNTTPAVMRATEVMV